MTLTIWLLIAGAAAVVGVVAYLLLRQRSPREEPFLHFRCPGCGRRLRFRARQSGHTGRCSHCGRDLVFPPASQAID